MLLTLIDHHIWQLIYELYVLRDLHAYYCLAMQWTNPTGTVQKHVLHTYIQLKAVKYPYSDREI